MAVNLSVPSFHLVRCLHLTTVMSVRLVVFYNLQLDSVLPSTLFFFNDPASTEIYTLSLHDALPISAGRGPRRRRGPSTGHLPRPRARKGPGEPFPDRGRGARGLVGPCRAARGSGMVGGWTDRSEEQTSELRSRSDPV